MCLLILQRPGAKILPEDHMRKAWESNHDGSGYCFVNQVGELVVRKPYFKLKPFLAAYQADFAEHGLTSPFIVHFRFTTHGKNDETNTHPHLVAAGRVCFAHNGVLPWTPANKDFSDTVHFAHLILAMRSQKQLLSPEFGKFLEGVIGSNKLAFIDKDRNHLIVNESDGHWHSEDPNTWYSNHSYVQSRYTFSSDDYLGYYPARSRGALYDDGDDTIPHGGSCLVTPKKRRPLGVRQYTPDDLAIIAQACAKSGSYPSETGIDFDLLNDEEWRDFIDAYNDARSELAPNSPLSVYHTNRKAARKAHPKKATRIPR